MTLEHEPTTTIAPGLLWTYQFIATVVLVNLLIAQMADTYGRVTADGVIRWQFERAGLILEYKDGKPPLPPPFNVLCFLYYMGRGAMARCHGAVTGDVPTPAAGFKRVTDAMQQSILARRESAALKECLRQRSRRHADSAEAKAEKVVETLSKLEEQNRARFENMNGRLDAITAKLGEK